MELCDAGAWEAAHVFLWLRILAQWVDGGRGGDCNVHLLCWCSLDNSHSDPICPVNIYDPLLYTKACSRHQKSQLHGEEISQEALSQEEAQSMLSRAAKE